LKFKKARPLLLQGALRAALQLLQLVGVDAFERFLGAEVSGQLLRLLGRHGCAAGMR
jgi:hypothetical protein